MAGPPPKEKRSRARDTPVRETIKSDGKLGGFDLRELPEDFLPLKPKHEWANEKVPEREEWHPATLRWWDRWRSSPQATRMTTDVDWDYMLDTALMHHQMWVGGGRNSERAGEIRIRVAAFGATYADRLRLRIEVEVPEEYAVGNAKAGDDNVTSINERRSRLTGT